MPVLSRGGRCSLFLMMQFWGDLKQMFTFIFFTMFEKACESFEGDISDAMFQRCVDKKIGLNVFDGV